MIRRQLFTWCVLAGLAGGVAVCPLPTMAQQPQAPGRAKVQTSPAAQPRTQQPGAPAQPGVSPQAQPRAPRPGSNLVQTEIPKELEELLIAWERESSKIEKLRGHFDRFTYDKVYFVDKRAEGDFYYQSPDLGRIDFGPSTKTYPSEKKGPKGEQYTVQQEGHQRWICNGKMIYIINDDAKLVDPVQIPAHQQGKNIVNGPLPFLFGMKAEQAKQRYNLKLGSMHSPRQIHVVATPKYQHDAAEWCHAEVLLDAVEFVPTAIRLINPQKTQETVYRFSEQKKNGTWFNNPFNDRPPSGYTISPPQRATNDETPVEKPK